MILRLALVPLIGLLCWQGLHLATRRKYPVHDHGGILVTGASSGIGRHVAVSLAKRGYHVFAGCRKEQDLVSIQEEDVPTLHGIIIDVTKQNQIDAARDHISMELGILGEPFVALVNNAGVAKSTVVEFIDIETAKWIFDVNFFGIIRVTKAFLPLLREAGEGSRIVQVSSVSGILSSRASAMYSGSKFAVEALNDALRLEVDPWGISTSAVNPAFVSSKILDKLKADNTRVEDSYSKEQLELYGHIFNEANKANGKRMSEKASSPQVTTDVIEHAITSAYPQVRYICANVDGTPAWIFVWMKWVFPERLFDAIVLSVQEK